MEVQPTGIVATVLVLCGLGGGTYAVTGSSDFTVDVGRPMPEVYETFSGVRTFGSGLRGEGFDVPEVRMLRPSNHELVFIVPSTNPNEPSRIAFTFKPGANPATTRVTAAIDVPPIETYIDGSKKKLSEDKVEAKFKEAIGNIAEQMNQGNSTDAAANKLTLLLDVVAISSHPDLMHKMRARILRVQAAERRINREISRDRSERFGYEYRYGDYGYRRYGEQRFGEPSDGRRRSYAERRGSYNNDY